MLSTHIYSDNSLTCTIPVIPKCMTGNLPSPERVIQKLRTSQLNAEPGLREWLAHVFPFRSHPVIVRPSIAFAWCLGQSSFHRGPSCTTATRTSRTKVS